MSRTGQIGILVVAAIGIAVGAYSFGRMIEEKEASAYLLDVSTHLTASCSNEHVVTLADLREGKIAEAIRGLELLVIAKLERIDIKAMPNDRISKKSIDDLRALLATYQAKYPGTAIEPKKTSRLNSDRKSN